MLHAHYKIVPIVLAVVLAGAGAAWARSSSGSNLDRIADDFYWAHQERQLRPNLSGRGNAAWVKKLDGFEHRLGRIKSTNLGGQHKITQQMLGSAIQRAKEHVTGGWINSDLNSVDSLMLTVYQGVDGTEKRNVNDWRWVIKTLEHSGKFMDDYIKLLDRGAAKGQMQPRDVVRSCLETLSFLTSSRASRNPLLALEQELAESMAGRRQLPVLRRQLRRALNRVALPAHARLKSYLRRSYLPRAPRNAGGDPGRYLHHMARYLGPGYNPRQLAAYGRREVKRLHGEMARTARKIAPGTTSLRSFMHGFNRRQSSAFNSGSEMLKTARGEVKRAERFARKMATVPRSRITVEAVSPAEEAVIDAQYYSTGSRSGVLQLNAGPLLSSISRYELANLVTHEAFGGHHLQSLHARKQRRLPAFRQDASLTVSDEGWAVYAEHWRNKRRGYKPAERLGHLVNQTWAAASLVVDVGLHTGTMTRRQAEDYMARALFTGREGVTQEVDRMLNLPGHGLAYYVGKRELLKTRRQVKRVLGPRFEERGFHDKLLSLGSVPPQVARKAMTSWARRRAGQLPTRAKRRATRSVASPRARFKK
jgi:uncharacterized protein (DUF885 family)